MFEQIRANWLNRKAAKINAGRVTVADFMRNLGVDEADVKRYRGAFGTKVRDTFEMINGAKPPKAGAEVVKMGKKHVLVATYAYRWDELGILIQTALAYEPVAKAIGA